MASLPKGRLNQQTIHKDGEGKLVGFIGEIYMDHIFELIFPELPRKVEADNSYDYDIVLDETKVDVKTKQRTVAVESDHDVSIAHYTKNKQMCDTYMFCSVTVDRATKTIPQDFFFMGYMDKSEFMTKATFRKKGQPDGGNRRPDGTPFTITKDCWNLKCNQLNQFDRQSLLPLLDYGYQLIQW